MATIKSGASADELTIDPTSKAARVTLYDAQGNQVLQKPDGGYFLPIFVRQTAATAANAAVWAMRNITAGKSLYIRRLVVNVLFDGTVGASQSRYELMRHRTATYTGGTALTVVKRDTADGASVVTDARFLDTGLTVGAVTVDTLLAALGSARQNGAVANYLLEWPSIAGAKGALVIANGDGLVLRLGITAVVGDGIQGYIEWEER